MDTDQVWTMAKPVFRWEGSDAIEEHRDQEYMLTSSGRNVLSAGAVMGAWVEPAGRGQTQVTVVTKRRVATNLATTLTETTFQKRFAQAVALVKAGQPLPLTPPEYPRGMSCACQSPGALEDPGRRGQGIGEPA